jgi:micrococcal nuclease
MMRNSKISFAVLLFTCLICFAFAQTIISWEDASEHYGETVIVEGTIVATYNSGNACFLNFHEDYKTHFSVVIFKSDFGKFPDSPEEYYLNKKVQVEGKIKEYKGKPEIILKDPAKIKIIAS